MERLDKVSSLFWLFVSVIMCIESSRLSGGLGTLHEPGPALFPFSIGILLGLFSLTLFLRSIQRGTTGGRDSLHLEKDWRKIILVLAALFVYSICLDILGFLIDTFLLFFFLFRFMGGMKWTVATGGSLLASSTSYGVFQLLLSVRLPKGFLGF